MSENGASDPIELHINPRKNSATNVVSQIGNTSSAVAVVVVVGLLLLLLWQARYVTLVKPAYDKPTSWSLTPQSTREGGEQSLRR